jgi:Mg2+ and Co2+ transporter CorA
VDIKALENRFTFHPPTSEDIKDNYQRIRGEALKLALLINELAPESNEKDNAIDCLDEAVMWANAGIARANI